MEKDVDSITHPRWDVIETICDEIDGVLETHAKNDSINFLELSIIIMMIKEKLDQEKYLFYIGAGEKDIKKKDEPNPDFYM